MTPGFIDVNVSLGTWPFMDFRIQTAAALAKHLAAEGIAQAWVSAVEPILFTDPDVHDEQLFSSLARFPSLFPVKTINPLLGGWRASLERALKVHRVRRVKIHPNYHQFALNDPRVDAMAEELVRRGIPLLIQMRVEDERNQHPLMQVPGVPAETVSDLAANHPALKVVALCAYRGEAATLVAGRRNVWVDLSFIECQDTLETLCGEIPADRILFGSNTPFLYTRPAVMKVTHAGIAARIRTSVACGNARTLGSRIAPKMDEIL
ncbi:MAG: amidohydrolase [Candidatus Marinimicrobia bacterium]|nr:amidohydrolase [Candidatus Neomarinimicrobiota bacterium]